MCLARLFPDNFIPLRTRDKYVEKLRYDDDDRDNIVAKFQIARLVVFKAEGREEAICCKRRVKRMLYWLFPCSIFLQFTARLISHRPKQSSKLRAIRDITRDECVARLI